MFYLLFFPIPFILQLVLAGIVGGGLGGGLMAGLIHLLTLSLKEAKSIAIFGSKGAGKTTLWKQLKGEFEDRKYIATLGKEDIDEFTIEVNGKQKTIKKSADFGGDDQLVTRYGEIIETETFIFYLIELTKLEELKQETRSRLQAITKVIKDKEVASGIKLIGTHFKEYNEKTGLNKDDAKRQLYESLGISNIKDVKVDDSILIVELTDKQDIDSIIKQILV